MILNKYSRFLLHNSKRNLFQKSCWYGFLFSFLPGVVRAAAFDREGKSCAMSQIDRNMAGRKALVALESKHDYIELACGLKPDRMCEFQSIREKIMKTVDAVYLDTESTDECRQR